MKKMKIKFLYRPVQRMRNIIAILALFVCTSICLGREVSIPAPLDDEYHNYAANVEDVLVKEDTDPGNNDWIAPVGCILNIDRDDSRIGAYACGARMCGIDAGGIYWYDVEGGRRMTGNKINVSTGWFKNSIIAGAYCGIMDAAAAVDNNAVTITATQGGNIQYVYGGYIQYDGTATLNTVELTGVTVTKDVYGAWIGRDLGAFRKAKRDGYASSNTVTIISGAVQNVYGGYIEEKGTATLNKINLTDADVTQDIFGAWIGTNGLVSSNTVIITSGTVRNVYGGWTNVGIVSSNTVIITTGTTVTLDVVGGRVNKGDAIDNRVTLISGTVLRSIYGGYSFFSGTATLNEVHLTSVTVKQDVYGAKIGKYGLASSNTVTIISGTVKNVYGGYIALKGTATLNEVHLTSVTVTKDVYGARVGNGLARDNTVTISGGKIEGEVGGGYIVNNGTATLNKVHLTSVTVSSDVCGAQIGNDGYASSNTVTIISGTVQNVYGGYIKEKGTATLNEVHLTDVKDMKNVYGAWIRYRSASSNTVTITSGTVQNVYGGYIALNGTATLNEVHLTSVTVSNNVYGARIGAGLASSNTVTIKGGKIEGEVYGVCITKKGTATLNEVHLTSVTVTKDVFGAKIEKFVVGINYGLASSNTVTIIGGTVKDVYGGLVVTTGTASSNTVTINGGTVRGNVFGGYIGGNGEAIYNTITIIGNAEFSTATILCGGVCANTTTTDMTTNDAFTGNTLNIETKGVVVKGISNFENYNFYLKNIKSGEVILTATSGGCSWDVGELDYTSACVLDLSRENIKNISLRTQGVINKGEYCTLIKSPQGLKYDGKYKQIEFENEGLLVKYYWDIKIADNKQDLIAILTDKRIRDEGVAKSLSEGYGAGIVCTNNGMDCVLGKMEETESVLGEGAKLQRKGEIGVFCGLAANKYKSSYNEGSHIDMAGMSMMGGVGIRVEVGSKKLSFKELSSEGQSPKEQRSKEQSSKEFSFKKLSLKELISELSFKKLSSELTAGVFGEYGTGNSDIDSGLCPCEKKSEGKSNYVGGGLLGRYSICGDEFSGTKLYLEAILRAGRVNNSFNSKELKDGTGKEYKYDYDDAMYGGCALGVGYKRKVSEKIDVDWSLRYMFGCQGGKDVKRVDADGSRVNFESVTSNRIRVGVKGKYVELEKVKPYIGIGYEHELGGKVKGKMQNGKDIVGDIPVTSFGGGTGIMEVGASGKVWKLGVDISGQGYVGVRKGFGGLLKLKYAFGKDTHAKPPKPQPKD